MNSIPLSVKYKSFVTPKYNDRPNFSVYNLGPHVPDQLAIVQHTLTKNTTHVFRFSTLCGSIQGCSSSSKRRVEYKKKLSILKSPLAQESQESSACSIATSLDSSMRYQSITGNFHGQHFIRLPQQFSSTHLYPLV